MELLEQHLHAIQSAHYRVLVEIETINRLVASALQDPRTNELGTGIGAKHNGASIGCSSKAREEVGGGDTSQGKEWKSPDSKPAESRDADCRKGGRIKAAESTQVRGCLEGSSGTLHTLRTKVSKLLEERACWMNFESKGKSDVESKKTGVEGDRDRHKLTSTPAKQLQPSRKHSGTTIWC